MDYYWIIISRKIQIVSIGFTNLDVVICVHYDGNEDAEDDVDEQTDEGVQIDSTEEPHGPVDLCHCRKSCVDVITINKAVQAFQ